MMAAEVEANLNTEADRNALLAAFYAIVTTNDTANAIDAESGDEIAARRVAEDQLALSSWVDPDTLIFSSDTVVPELVRSRLYQDCEVAKQESGMVWRMNAVPRSNILHARAASEELSSILSTTPATNDPTEIWLRRALTEGSSLQIDALGQNDLCSLDAALTLLSAVDRDQVSLPNPKDIRRRIGQATAFDEYDILLQNGLIGRKRELAQLQRFLRRPVKAQWAGLVLRGSGGSGKSTLLARFVKDLVTTKSSPKYHAAVAILDFDRPGMDANSPQWMEAEISRQIGYQYLNYAEQLSQARQSVRQNIAANGAMGGNSPNQTSLYRSQRHDIFKPITDALNQESNKKQSLVLILDTFEEVQQRDQSVSLLKWVDEIASVLLPIQLKVIISGRLFASSEEPEDEEGYGNSFVGLGKSFRVEDVFPDRDEIRDKDRIDLGDFTSDEKADYLRALGVPEKYVGRIVSSPHFPARPLYLKLLARALEDNPNTTLDEIESDLKNGGPNAKRFFAGVVYKRVLERIHGEDAELIRKLAYPGLILRYVTRELIQQVLVPTLDMEPITDEVADRALNRMADYNWLSYRQDNKVWHRRDLRRYTLKAMIAEDQARADRIHQAAVNYFAPSLSLPRNQSKKNDQDFAEGLYHRLMLIHDREDGSDLMVSEIQNNWDAIAASRGDLYPAAMALVTYATKGGMGLALEEFQLLPTEFERFNYHIIGARYVTNSRYLDALNHCLNHRKRGVTVRFSSLREQPLAPWEVEAMFATVHWVPLTRLDIVTDLPLWPEIEGTNHYQRERLLATKARVSRKSYLELSQIMLQPLSSAIRTPQYSSFELDDAFHEIAAVTILSIFRLQQHLYSADRLVFEQWHAFLAGQDLYNNWISKYSTFHLILLVVISIESGFNRDRRIFQIIDRHKSLLSQYKSFVRLCPDWLTEFSSLLNLKSTETVINAFYANKDRQNVRGLLGSIDAIEDKFDPISFWGTISSKLPYYFRGPDPEWRIPCRYALLEAYPDAEGHRRLGEIMHGLIDFDLSDLTPEAFARAIASNPEHEMEIYIELIDRAWQMPELVRQTRKDQPKAPKLARFATAYLEWDTAVNNILIHY